MMPFQKPIIFTGGTANDMLSKYFSFEQETVVVKTGYVLCFKSKLLRFLKFEVLSKIVDVTNLERN